MIFLGKITSRKVVDMLYILSKITEEDNAWEEDEIWGERNDCNPYFTHYVDAFQRWN